jgi:hypothetical protein
MSNSEIERPQNEPREPEERGGGVILLTGMVLIIIGAFLQDLGLERTGEAMPAIEGIK